jgi:hypothetical protein
MYTLSQQSTVPSQPPAKITSRKDLSDIHEHSEDELLSDLDEMINNVPSDEEPDPNMSPAPFSQSTPFTTRDDRSKSKNIGREIFHRDPSPIHVLKSAQKPATTTKTPAKTVDFQDPNVFPSFLRLIRFHIIRESRLRHPDTLLLRLSKDDLPHPENSQLRLNNVLIQFLLPLQIH